LGYAALSDLIQHVRATPALSLAQISKVVSVFSQVLHDASLPMSTQYTAVRTLLSVLDAVFSNKDRDPQLGRDLLVRILRTLVEKLSTLHQANNNDSNSSSIHLAEEVTVGNNNDNNNNREYHASLETKNEPLRDKKCIVRAIVVGSKTLIWYINNYRVQREKEMMENIQSARVGVNNEEAYSGLSKITHTEHALIDKYIVLGIPCIKILKERDREEAEFRTSATATAGERPAPEQFRDTLTYFAAAFTTLDGHDLRRILGRRLDVLVQAVKDDPTAIVVPRHLLSANASTSFEFCSMMLNFLVKRIDHLVLVKGENIHFLSISSENYNEKCRLEAIQNRVEEKENVDEEDMKKSSNAYLQLFERILKSLSSYPENERALRPHLKKIVSTCLRSSLEKTEVRADNYCMLLRYVFRSISAGKFEESYRELLPLIPAVLNGLFRILSSTDDTTLCHTLIELVLTIPARLSSLLPHMNLLLRVIIMALESNSDDLVNLGYVSHCLIQSPILNIILSHFFFALLFLFFFLFKITYIRVLGR
jgi:transformation/transcription domain-associated protein